MVALAYCLLDERTDYYHDSYDTIAEGIGLDRVTKNFSRAHIDDAIQVTDKEMTEMAAYLVRGAGVVYVVVLAHISLLLILQTCSSGKMGSSLDPVPPRIV